MTIGFYLAGCHKCFRETGRYTATFTIKGPREYMQSGIKEMSIKGNIIAIDYEGARFTESLKLYIQ